MHFECIYNALPMHFQCISNVLPMHSKCIYNAFPMHFQGIDNSFPMHVKCIYRSISNARTMQLQCIKNAFSMNSNTFPLHLKCTSNKFPRHFQSIANELKMYLPMHFQCTSNACLSARLQPGRVGSATCFGSFHPMQYAQLPNSTPSPHTPLTHRATLARSRACAFFYLHKITKQKLFHFTLFQSMLHGYHWRRDQQFKRS